MKDQIIPVNNEALKRALEAVVGNDAAALVVKAYAAIDAAMAYGYAKGAEASRESLSQEQSLAFQRGWDAADADYDDGYCDGVSDARAFPEYADSEVARMVSEDEYATFDPSEYTSVDDVDSGDETDTREVKYSNTY